MTKGCSSAGCCAGLALSVRAGQRTPVPSVTILVRRAVGPVGAVAPRDGFAHGPARARAGCAVNIVHHEVLEIFLPARAEGGLTELVQDEFFEPSEIGPSFRNLQAETGIVT